MKCDFATLRRPLFKSKIGPSMLLFYVEALGLELEDDWDFIYNIENCEYNKTHLRRFIIPDSDMSSYADINLTYITEKKGILFKHVTQEWKSMTSLKR